VTAHHRPLRMTPGTIEEYQHAVSEEIAADVADNRSQRKATMDPAVHLPPGALETLPARSTGRFTITVAGVRVADGVSRAEAIAELMEHAEGMNSYAAVRLLDEAEGKAAGRGERRGLLVEVAP
jgi:hypothetical protein